MLGHTLVVSAYLATFALRWFPAISAVLLGILYYDAFYTEHPLLDAWSEQGQAQASFSWAHFFVWAASAWLLFEATVWPLFLFQRAWLYTKEKASNPPRDPKHRADIFTAMVHSFATFHRVRKHPRGSKEAHAAIAVRASVRNRARMPRCPLNSCVSCYLIGVVRRVCAWLASLRTSRWHTPEAWSQGHPRC